MPDQRSALTRKTLAVCMATALTAGSAAVLAATASPTWTDSTWSALASWRAFTDDAARSAQGRRYHNPRAERTMGHAEYRQAYRSQRRGASHPAAKRPERPAATFTVTNCNDSGAGSLRDATENAVDGDTIDLTALTCSTISLSSGHLATAEGHIEVLGPGRDALTIEGDGKSQIFYSYGLGLSDLTIANGHRYDGFGGCVDASEPLALTRTTITGCTSGDGANPAAYGGGVHAYDGLTMTDSTVSDSHSTAYYMAAGGGIYVRGDATISNSTISGNSAYGPVDLSQGGGILVVGKATITDSFVTDNEAYSVDGQAYGGGVGQKTGSKVTITRSTVSGNTADSINGWSYGGGVNVGMSYYDDRGSLYLTNSTISDNRVSADSDYILKGGGAHAMNAIVLTGSTISGNAVESSGPNGKALGGGLAIYGGVGGGIVGYNSTLSGNSVIAGADGLGEGGAAFSGYSPFDLFSGTVSFNTASHKGGGLSGSKGGGVNPGLTSTIVALNEAPDGADVSNPTTNPLTIDGKRSVVMSASSDITLPLDTLSSDPMLLPLADNGGPTWTHALTSSSPAIDAGIKPPFGSYPFDQRGEPFVRQFGDAVDIGAFEWQGDEDDDIIFANGFEALPEP